VVGRRLHPDHRAGPTDRDLPLTPDIVHQLASPRRL
jgi:hypothetical protein